MAGRDITLARLAYVLEAETKGLKADLDAAEGSLGKFSKFVVANPVASLGALGAAALGVGLKATQMAAEVDTAVRKIGASLPEATGRFDELKAVAEELAKQFGVSQVEIVDSMNAIARGGVDSVEDLIAATKAVQLAVKATGEETGTIVGLLDTTLDAFNLSAKDSEAVLAKLFVTAQGKTNLADLVAIFDRLAAPLAEAGIGFDVAARAAATLIGEGKSSKVVLAELTKTLNEGGTPAIEALAARSQDAGDGLKEMREQAALNNTSLASLQAQLRENLNAAMIDLGTRILPVVLQGLQGFLGLLDTLNGTVARIEGNSAVATIQSIGGAVKSLSDQAAAEALKRLEGALGQVTQGIGTLSPALRNVSDKDLPGLRVGLQSAIDSGDLSTTQMSRFTVALRLVDEQIAKKGIKPLAESLGEVTGGATSGTAAVETLTAAERRAVQSSKELSAEQKAGILNTKNLTDAQKELVEKAVKELGKRSVEAAKELKALRDEIESTFAASTTTLIDDTAEAIRRFEEKAKRVNLPAAEVKAFTTQLRAQGVALESIRLSAGLANEALKDPDPELALRQVGAALEVARDLLNDLAPGTEAYNTVLDRTTELLDAQKEIQRRIKTEVETQLERERQLEALARGETVLLDGKIQRMDMVTGIISEQGVALEDNNKKVKTKNERLQETIEKVGSVATGVLGVATAFGIVDDEAANVLANVINIGTNIGKAFGGDPAAIVSVLGSVAGVLGSVFGDNPADRERKRIMRENTERLAELVEVNGDLVGALSTGKDVAGVGKVLGGIDFDLANKVAKSGPNNANAFLTDLLRPALQAAGLTFSDLDQVAKDLGIQIRDKDGRLNVAGLQQLLQAIGQVDTGAPKTFRGKKRVLEDEIGLGIRDESTRFGGLLEAGGDNLISRSLKGIDVSTDAGRAQATDILRQIFADLNAGKLSVGDLGDLSRDDFDDLVQDLLGILGSDQAIAGPGNQGSTDPVDVGDDIATSFSTALDETLGEGSPAVDYLAEIARNTAGFSPVAPPSLPAGLLGGVTGSPNITITFGPTSVSVGAGAVADPGAIASAVDSAISDRAQQLVDELLGQAILDAERPSARRRVN